MKSVNWLKLLMLGIAAATEAPVGVVTVPSDATLKPRLAATGAEKGNTEGRRLVMSEADD